MGISEKRLREIMKRGQECSAWPVCLMIAKDLGDEPALNEFADELLEIVKFDIPLRERTPYRLKQEKARILADVK